MDEDIFRSFYEYTARSLRAYLRSVLNDHALVDDIMQESYFRMLKAGVPVHMELQHRKNYLYRIASNLVNDHRRSRKVEQLPEELPGNTALEMGALVDEAHDIAKAFERLKPREQDLLWLAYVECFTHQEIGGILHLGAASIRPMLSRARSKFARLLRRRSVAG
jgi:RNA polymerase sigma-70 factor, ECF subfamily